MKSFPITNKIFPLLLHSTPNPPNLWLIGRRFQQNGLAGQHVRNKKSLYIYWTLLIDSIAPVLLWPTHTCYVISTLVLILMVLMCTPWYYTKVYCTKMQYFVKYWNICFRDLTGIVKYGHVSWEFFWRWVHQTYLYQHDGCKTHSIENYEKHTYPLVSD